MPSTNPIIDYLDGVQERVDAATPGPWKTIFSAPTAGVIRQTGNKYALTQDPQDAYFIAAARTDVDRMERMLRVAVEGLEHAKVIGSGTSPANSAVGRTLDKLRRIAEGKE